MPQLSIDELTKLAARALEKAGASTSMALASAKALVAAEMEGLTGHGCRASRCTANSCVKGAPTARPKPGLSERKVRPV